MDEDPQYDYAYSNFELISNDKKKQNFIGEVKGLVSHVAHKVTLVASDIGADNRTPQFNDRLAMPNIMGVSHVVGNHNVRRGVVRRTTNRRTIVRYNRSI